MVETEASGLLKMMEFIIFYHSHAWKHKGGKTSLYLIGQAIHCERHASGLHVIICVRYIVFCLSEQISTLSALTSFFKAQSSGKTSHHIYWL